MKCLVCDKEFDHDKPIVIDPALLAAGIPQVDLEVAARRQRATEQSAWKFVQVFLDGNSIVEGHVCPAHANAQSLQLAKGAGASQ